MVTRRKVWVRILPTPEAELSDNTSGTVFPPTPICYVNDDKHPLLINNEHFTGHAVMRILNYSGLTPMDEESKEKLPVIPYTDYFNGRKRRFSFQVEGRFRKSWNGDDVMFGTYYSKPISIPRLANIAISAAKYIDPALNADLSCEKPFSTSPLLCGMNVIYVRTAPDDTRDMSEDTREIAAHRHSAKKHHYHNLLPSKIKKSSQETNELKQLFSHFNINEESQKTPPPLPLPLWMWGGENLLQENLLCKQPLPGSEFLCAKPDIENGEDEVKTINHTEISSNRRSSSPAALEIESQSSYSLKKGAMSIFGLSSKNDSQKSKTLKGYERRERSLSIYSDNSSNYEISTVRRTKMNSQKRRNFFLKSTHRQAFTFHPSNAYSFEFSSTHAELNTLTLKLGMEIDVMKYLNGQPIIYEARSRDGSAIFFRVEIGYHMVEEDE